MRCQTYFAGFLSLLFASFLMLGAWSEAAAQEGGSSASDVDGARQLTIAAVQFEVSEELLTSEESYVRAVANAVGEAAGAGADLVLFPEYAAAFLAAVPYSAEIAASRTLAGALRRIAARPQEPTTLRKLFIESAPEVLDRMDRIYGSLARRHNVHILAGTYFAASRGERGALRLTNRAVVYAPTGRRSYEQDKVFLTPFERELLGLESGRATDADGFEVEDVEVGVTICRDTFFDIWDTLHEDRHVWVDIKADGTRFDDVARSRYFATIPERLEKSDVPFGVTVSLVGEFLDFFWEGMTSFVASPGRELRMLDSAPSYRRSTVLVESIEVMQ